MLWEDTLVVTADQLREVMEIPLPEVTALLAPVPAATDPPVPAAIKDVSLHDLTLVRR